MVAHTHVGSLASVRTGKPIASGYGYDSLVANIYSIAQGAFANNAHAGLLSSVEYSFAKFCKENGSTAYVTLYRTDDDNPSFELSCPLPCGKDVELVYDHGDREYRLILNHGEADVIVAARSSSIECMVDDKKRLVCNVSGKSAKDVPGFVVDGHGDLSLTKVDGKQISEWNLNRF